MPIYRHGDVNLIPAKLPAGSVLKKSDYQQTIAYGETTGHNHDLVTDREQLINLYEHEGRTYIEVFAQSRLTHPEHKEIIVLPDVYEQVQEREKDWFSLAIRNVID